MLTLRTFRAIDDLDSCTLFADGHAKVLLDYGVTKVTSSSTAWFFNPSVYAIIAEITETNEIVGGVRIHIADGVNRLPMEDAVAIVDTKIYDLISRYQRRGTAELCGLWNSKSTAGMGIGSYILMRAGLSMAPQYNLETIFALCAPHTLKISVDKGFEIEKSIGNEGTFIYPKLDLIATSIIIRDLKHLPLALPAERESIFELRQDPCVRRMEQGPKWQMDVKYNLDPCVPTPSLVHK